MRFSLEVRKCGFRRFSSNFLLYIYCGFEIMSFWFVQKWFSTDFSRINLFIERVVSDLWSTLKKKIEKQKQKSGSRSITHQIDMWDKTEFKFDLWFWENSVFCNEAESMDYFFNKHGSLLNCLRNPEYVTIGKSACGVNIQKCANINLFFQKFSFIWIVTMLSLSVVPKVIFQIDIWSLKDWIWNVKPLSQNEKFHFNNLISNKFIKKGFNHQNNYSKLNIIFFEFWEC